MKIVNQHLAQSIREQGMLKEPNSYGYIYLAAEVEKPHPIKSASNAKRALLKQLIHASNGLPSTLEHAVRRADVFNALIIPPGSAEGRRVLKEYRYPAHVAKFDIVILVECVDVNAAREVRQHKAFLEMERTLEQAAEYTNCFVAKNPKRIAEVDKTRNGIFLFNHFFAADVDAKGTSGTNVLLDVWEYTAGWWTAKANLTNSTPLQPLDGEATPYSLVNHCRWDRISQVLPHLLFRPSMGKFVLGNFTANNIVAMPILYRLAN